MAGSGTVTVNIIGKADKLRDAFKDGEKSAKGFGDRMDNVGGKLKDFGKNVVAFGAVAGTALIAFGTKAVMAASDVEESLSKVNTVFGAQGKEIDAWAKGAAKSFGMSRGAALDAAGGFGNMFTQLGIGQKEAAKMSKGIIELSADFASFHNADISEVIAAQEAAFRGEYDSIQKFLPLMKAATVEQKAMEMTGKSNAKALTDQEKALAVNALMMEGAGKAAGDFDRTNGSLANQMRILKAEGENFAASVGSVLLPMVLKALEIGKEWAANIKDFLAPVFAFLKEQVEQNIEPVREKFFQVRDTVKEVVDNVVGWFKDFISNFRSTSSDTGSEANKLMDIFRQVKEVVSSAFGAIKEIISTAIDFIKGVWRVFGDDILSFIRETVAAILEVVRGLLNALEGVFNLIKAVLTGKWGEAWDALKQIVDGVWDAIFGIVRNAVTNVIPTIIAGLGQAVSSVARTAFDGIKSAFRGAINWLIDAWNGLDFTIGGWKINGPLGTSVTLPEFTVGLPHVPRIHTGGVIPGPLGSEQLYMAQAGERVLPRGAANGGPTRIVLQVDGRTLGEVTLNSLLDLQSRNGTLGIEAA